MVNQLMCKGYSISPVAVVSKSEIQFTRYTPHLQRVKGQKGWWEVSARSYKSTEQTNCQESLALATFNG